MACIPYFSLVLTQYLFVELGKVDVDGVFHFIELIRKAGSQNLHCAKIYVNLIHLGLNV